jgi:hypothetical protein
MDGSATVGWVLMSERDLNRLEVLAQIDDGHLSVGSGANMLGLTRRQIFQLLKLSRENGRRGIGEARADAPGGARLPAAWPRPLIKPSVNSK